MLDGHINSNAPSAGDSGLPTVAGRYNQLITYRDAYLNRAYDCAELTIPSLLPRFGHTSTTVLPTPWQSVGARGVNHLSSKLLMTLFPPNTPIFKFVMDQSLISQIEQQAKGGEQDAKNLKTEFDKAFASMERMIMAEIEKSGDRTGLFECLKHLLVTGNSLVHQSKQGMRVFPLSQFVVRRDPAGNPLEIILKEDIDPVALPKMVLEALKSQGVERTDYAAKKSVELYTYTGRTETEWVTYQEVGGHIIEKTRGTFPLEKNPWIALRFNKINGEDYGRGYVEEYIGDFTSLENLTAAIVSGSAAASKVLFLVKPNSSTKIRVITRASNGAVVSGNAEDITVMRVDKAQDFGTAKAMSETFETRLSYAFLLNTAIQREAERVTAEEIRYMAEELEQTLGGFYSIMSIELQLPYIQLKIDELQRKGKMPKLPKDSTRPVIVTGLEALGRGNDRNKLVKFLQTLSNALGPEAVQKYVNVSEAIERLAISDGIETKGLIRTPQEIAAETRQQQMMSMGQDLAGKLGPSLINQFGGAAGEQVKGEQDRITAGQQAELATSQQSGGGVS